MEWFRLYDDVLDDPKVQRLSAKMFRHWVQLLCLANKGSVRGRIPKDIEAIAFRLRVRKTDAEMTLSTLVSLQLLVETDTDYIPYNWDKRQKKSDSSAERVAAHRAKQEEEVKESNVTDPLPKRDGNALDTEQIRTETEAEQTRAETDAPAALADEPYTQDFLAFMDAYGPTNGPKRPAFTAWKKLGRADRTKAMNALPAWLACGDWQEGFKPYPQKYLNQRFFEKFPVQRIRAPNGVYRSPPVTPRPERSTEENTRIKAEIVARQDAKWAREQQESTQRS